MRMESMAVLLLGVTVRVMPTELTAVQQLGIMVQESRMDLMVARLLGVMALASLMERVVARSLGTDNSFIVWKKILLFFLGFSFLPFKLM
jgi:hypothetical protein